jgi:hypothetical protein
MKFKSRITRLEAKRPPSPWVPPIFFHSIVEPSENGPREVGVFAKIYDDGNDLMVWREDNETKYDFEARVLAMQSSEH